jgi:hypothetical protein
MNDTKIIDAVHGRIAAVDVTSRSEFEKLLSLVNYAPPFELQPKDALRRTLMLALQEKIQKQKKSEN